MARFGRGWCARLEITELLPSEDCFGEVHAGESQGAELVEELGEGLLRGDLRRWCVGGRTAQVGRTARR